MGRVANGKYGASACRSACALDATTPATRQITNVSYGLTSRNAVTPAWGRLRAGSALPLVGSFSWDKPPTLPLHAAIVNTLSLTRIRAGGRIGLCLTLSRVSISLIFRCARLIPDLRGASSKRNGQQHTKSNIPQHHSITFRDFIWSHELH